MYYVSCVGDGITLGNNLHIGVLDYADDAVLASESIDKTSEQVTNVSRARQKTPT